MVGRRPCGMATLALRDSGLILKCGLVDFLDVLSDLFDPSHPQVRYEFSLSVLQLLHTLLLYFLKPECVLVEILVKFLLTELGNALSRAFVPVFKVYNFGCCTSLGAVFVIY